MTDAIHTLCFINSNVGSRLLPWKPIFQCCLVNLKDILLTYDCMKFELHIFCSLGKISSFLLFEMKEVRVDGGNRSLQNEDAHKGPGQSDLNFKE